MKTNFAINLMLITVLYSVLIDLINTNTNDYKSDDDFEFCDEDDELCLTKVEEILEKSFPSTSPQFKRKRGPDMSDSDDMEKTDCPYCDVLGIDSTSVIKSIIDWAFKMMDEYPLVKQFLQEIYVLIDGIFNTNVVNADMKVQMSKMQLLDQ